MTMIEYLRVLFGDCGFSPSQQRDFLALRYGGRKYLDELTAGEQHALIDDLKNRKVTPLASEPEEDPEAELTAKERLKRRMEKHT